MSALCPRLWDIPLHHLAIPGERVSVGVRWRRGRSCRMGPEGVLGLRSLQRLQGGAFPPLPALGAPGVPGLVAASLPCLPPSPCGFSSGSASPLLSLLRTQSLDAGPPDPGRPPLRPFPHPTCKGPVSLRVQRAALGGRDSGAAPPPQCSRRVPCLSPVRAACAPWGGGAHGGRAGFLPGSHDTMTYSLNRRCPISHTQSPLLQLLARALPCVTLPTVLKWSVTQVSPRGAPAPAEQSPRLGRRWKQSSLRPRPPRWGSRRGPICHRNRLRDCLALTFSPRNAVAVGSPRARAGAGSPLWNAGKPHSWICQVPGSRGASEESARSLSGSRRAGWGPEPGRRLRGLRASGESAEEEPQAALQRAAARGRQCAPPCARCGSGLRSPGWRAAEAPAPCRARGLQTWCAQRFLEFPSSL